MMFEAQPKPMFGEINWQIRKGDNSELIIPVKVKLLICQRGLEAAQGTTEFSVSPIP